MAFFPFPSPSRKKMASHPSPRPMGKAHRILGALPLSIDSTPSNRDDASSSALSDDRSVTTATSCDPDSEPGDFFDDLSVGIAKSDNGWSDESGGLPPTLKLDDRSEDAAGTITSSILRKRRSSSTIKSWYDKTKLPLSISQQTSSSAMAKGLPVKSDRMFYLDLHSPSSLDVQTKSKKPTKLDLSTLMAGPRLIRKVSQRQLGGGSEPVPCSQGAVKPLAPPSPITTTERSRSAVDQGRGTPPALPFARPDVGGARLSNQWPCTKDALSALPTLYDHYEQMSIRHVMKQYSQPDMSRARTGPRVALPGAEWKWAQSNSMCRDVRGFPPPAPPTTLRSNASSPPLTSTSSLPCRRARPLKGSGGSFGSADLQQMSVLVLSDSEGDDAPDDISPSCTRANLALARRTSTTDTEVPPLVASRSHAVKKPTQSPEEPDTKSSKRASLQVETFLSSSMCSMSAATESSSRRASFASNNSASSAASEQSKRSGYSIREARAVTVLAARRPLCPEREDVDEMQQQTLDWGESYCQSIASSTDQITPPLSPTSVDFYIRSVRASGDGTGGHKRLMAVSRQEEMLLSALRQKQKTMRLSAVADFGERVVDGEKVERAQCRRPSATSTACTSRRRGSRDSHSEALQQTSTGDLTLIDLDLPDPWFSKNEARSWSERQSTRLPSRRWSAAAVPSRRRKRSSQGSGSANMDEEVPLVFDDADPSPDLSDYRDWHAAMTAGTTPAGKPSSRRDLFGSQPRGRRRGSTQSNPGCSPTQLHSDGFDRLSGVAEEVPGDADEEADVPRPDSPVSPESFPTAVPGRAND